MLDFLSQDVGSVKRLFIGGSISGLLATLLVFTFKSEVFQQNWGNIFFWVVWLFFLGSITWAMTKYDKGQELVEISVFYWMLFWAVFSAACVMAGGGAPVWLFTLV